MEPGSAIEQLGVLEDSRPCCFSTGERTAIIDFKLQIGEEAFYHCVVVGHALQVHVQRYFGFRRLCTVFQASVLAALIAMKGRPGAGE